MLRIQATLIRSVPYTKVGIWVSFYDRITRVLLEGFLISRMKMDFAPSAFRDGAPIPTCPFLGYR